MLAILKAGVDPRTMVIDRHTAEEVGLKCANIVKRQTVLLREPANSPATIAIKKSSNPLRDTGFLGNSATYRIIG